MGILETERNERIENASKILFIHLTVLDLPGRAVDKNPPANPWSAEDSTCRRATKPVHHTHQTLLPRPYAPLQEKPPEWEACTPQQRVDPARHN